MIDISDITLDNTDFVLPAVVPGRILNHDADFTAYQAASVADTEAGVRREIKERIATRMELAGATQVMVHLTAKDSDKGGRYEIATIKEYQGNRDTEKPELLEYAKEFLSSNYDACVWSDREADDGVTQYQLRCIEELGNEFVVLDSLDKDLRMVQGLHLCPETLKIVDVQGYGSCWYDADKKKVLGWGTSFFWHQVLMGDSVDNIPGLPAFSKSMTLMLWPTKQYTEMKRRLREDTMPSGKVCTYAQILHAERKIEDIEDATNGRQCGGKSAYDYLKDVDNDKDALAKVELAYKEYYGPNLFFVPGAYRKAEKSWGTVLLEQAYLLWMQRRHNFYVQTCDLRHRLYQKDVFDFIMESRYGEVQ